MQKYTMEEMREEIATYLLNEKLEYSEFGDDTYVHFHIVGWNYYVSVYIDADGIQLGTTHKERYKGNADLPDANDRKVKKLSTVYTYIEKYA